MKNKYRHIIFYFITALFVLLPLQSNAQLMSDYTAYPPFITNGVAPNILLLLDVSGSMQFPAYHDCTSFEGYTSKRASCGATDSMQYPDNSYDPDHYYYGLFNNDTYYEYNSNKFIETSSCSNPAYRIGDSSTCISGNLLNWATMSRIDLLRKALLGGKSVSQQTNAHTLRGEGGWWTYSDQNLRCTITIDGGSYPQLDHSVSISDYAGAGYLYVTSSGSQIIDTIDSFRFVFQSVTGDFDAKLLVKTPPDETGQTYAKAGLMVRTSTAADSQHVKAMATYGAGLQFSYRDADGANTVINGYVSVTYPYWVRITRVGNIFTYYYSSDGSSWTTHSTATVAMPAATPVLIGMASASYDAAALGTAEYDRFICDTCTVTDDNFDAGSLGASWTGLDINTSMAGNDSLSPATCMIGTLASASIKVDIPDNERRGVIQNISDKDNDGTFDANAPRFGLMVYGSDNRAGCIRSGIDGSNMSNLINAVQDEPPYYGTPTGEAFNEAWDYFIQSDDHNGCNNTAYIGGIGSAKDPWCDSGDPKACRKSYILHISDGMWDGSIDPVVPARTTHINDLRTDPGMDGTQILTWYNVYIFGDSQLGINSMEQSSMYGAFDDYDNNSWPYNRSAYPADSRNVTLPASPCNPSALPMDDGCEEWDKDKDGLPDTYYEASDGNELEESLIQAITDILKKASSGTAVSVLATTGEGEGAIYQAFFYPEKLENVEARHWLGYLHSIFVDKYGNLREDTNGNDTLDMSTDLILEMSYDQAQGTQVNKYLDADSDGKKDSTSPVATTQLENINPIWKGGEILWETSPGSRTIYTTINGYNKIDFTTTNLTSIEPYLRGADSTEATNIMNWVRGDDLPGITDTGHPDGYRERSITINGNTHVWKLGDIIYSTPTTVGSPMENYDLLYGDGTYTAFRYGYLNRRRVVYVGANDGMLHAFNAGCYSESDHKFYPDVSFSGSCTSGSHILGEELWAFIPRTLLPHLKWSTDPDYTHVYYVDSKPKVSDVKMFNADATHINGWGTILIGSLRYGGKDISWTSGATNYSTSPEYFALDITDPLNPQLLWTFSDPDLGLSMSYPAIVHIKTGSTHNWYAIFGSGATNFDSGSNLISFQDGHVYVLDIGSGNSAGKISTWTENTNFWKIATGNATAFLSDAISVDANLDNKADVMYIGENYKQGGTWNALMQRITTNYGVQTDPSQWVLSTLANVNSVAGTNDDTKRITAAPAIAIDDRWNFWVYFGTGQFYGLADKNQTETGAFYAIKDGCYNGSCTNDYTDILDVSGASVGADLSVTGVISGTCGSADGSWSNLLTASYACDGWSIYFKNLIETTDFTGTTLKHDGERSVSKPLVLGGLVMYATYIPGVDLCSYEGESNIYAVYYKTGTGYKKYIFKEQKDSGTTTQDIARVKKLGAGMPSSVSAQVTQSGSAKGFAQQSTGSILGVETETPISQKSGIVGWRDEAID